MKTIRRSAREVGSWMWSIPYTRHPNLRDILSAPQVAIDALQSKRILNQGNLRIFWEEKGSPLGEIASLPMPARNILTDLLQSAENSTPSSYKQPFINYIKVEGDGDVIFKNDCIAVFDRLTEVNVFHFSDSMDIELTIHHDIWFPYAFDGSPHPQVYENNAPRLAAALQQIESGLGQETEPGDGTFFGQPGRLGMLPPEDDQIIDGKRIEVTDISNVGWSFQEITCDNE